MEGAPPGEPPEPVHRVPWRRGLVACALVLLATTRSAAGLDAIVPDPLIQAAIASIPAAKTAAELDTALAKLREAVGGDHQRLVPQLLYFSMRGADVRKAMTAGVVIDRLPITKDDLLRGLVPYLDTSDPALQRQLRNLLGAIDEGPDAQSPDFSRYETVLRAQRATPPLVLVTHMLDTAPDTALVTLAQTLMDAAPARRALLDAAKSTDQAEIARLARDPIWWVRFYVVTRMRREPALRAPALLLRLSDDVHPAVRAAAAELAREPVGL